MADGNPTPTPGNASEPSPEQKRERVQLLLAKHHGFTSSIMEDSIIPTRLAGSIGEFRPGLAMAYGRAQDSLNTRQHDEGLANSSLAGAQFDPKERGFLYNMNRYYSAKHNRPNDVDARAKWAARGLR